MRLPFLALTSLLTGMAMAAPLPFRLCTLDQPFYPYTMPDGSGQLQQLLRLAVRGLPLQLSNPTAPRKRCLEGLRSGQYEAAIGTYALERNEYAAYPPSGARPEEGFALAVTRFVIYRRTGSETSWDGQHFSGLNGKAIGVQLGFSLSEKLRASGAALDEGARTAEQNFDKLQLGRLAAAIVQATEAEQLLAGRFAGKIEAIEPAFERIVLYLLVARPFYQAQPGLTEQLWQNIRSTRASLAYQKYLQQYR